MNDQATKTDAATDETVAGNTETGNAAAVQESATLTPTESVGTIAPVQPVSSESTVNGEAGNGVSAENVAASGSSLSSTEAATIGATAGSAELGTKTAPASDYTDDTKDEADTLLEAIERFLKHAEDEAMNVGGSLWHLIAHLRDARIHAKDVAKD